MPVSSLDLGPSLRLPRQGWAEQMAVSVRTKRLRPTAGAAPITNTLFFLVSNHGEGSGGNAGEK